MKKRLLKLSSLFLALTMVLSLFCAASLTSNAETNVIYVDATINEDDASTNTYKTLNTAVSKAAAGDTIVFKSDYEANEAVEVNIANITIDFGGYTYTVRNDTSAQGISVKKKGVVIQNGKMELDSINTTKQSSYFCIFNNQASKMTVKNIDFEFKNVGEANGANADRPGALIRNHGTETTDIYNCSFIYSGTRVFDDEALVASSYGTINLYNCVFEGNENKISAIQVRARNTAQSKIGIYNCDFDNLKYLFAKNAKLASTTGYNSAVTFYGATVNNAAALCAEPDNVTITAGEHATMPDLDTLTSPYSFTVLCNHKYNEATGVCNNCKANKPIIEMQEGAAMRIDGKTEGIRFSATVSTSDHAALQNDLHATITDYGMLVVPKANILNTAMIVENSETSTENNIAENPDVVAAKYGTETKPAEVPDTGKIQIVGSLVKIKEENVKKDYVARAYIEYKVQGDETPHYIYSDISDARSIGFVANQIKNGLGADSGYYASLCGNHKKVVDDWADKYNS